MEGCHQNAAIEGEEVHVAVEFVVDSCRSFAAVPGRGRTEPVFGAVTKAFDDPRQFKFFDDRFNASRELFLKRKGFGIKLIGEDIFQRGFHRRNRQGVTRQRAANPADIRIFKDKSVLEGLRHFFGKAIDRGGHSPSEGFAEGQEIRLEGRGLRYIRLDLCRWCVSHQ